MQILEAYVLNELFKQEDKILHSYRLNYSSLNTPINTQISFYNFICFMTLEHFIVRTWQNKDNWRILEYDVIAHNKEHKEIVEKIMENHSKNLFLYYVNKELCDRTVKE